MARATNENTLRYILTDRIPYYHDTYQSAQEERARLQTVNPDKEFRLLKVIGCQGVPSLEVLDKVKDDACKEKSIPNPDDEYLIWNDERKKWWESDRRGYTSRIDAAGVYSRNEAIKIVKSAMSLWGLLNDVMVRKTDAIDLIKPPEKKDSVPSVKGGGVSFGGVALL